MRQLIAGVFIFVGMALGLVGCADNPAVVPAKQPYLSTSPHGVPHYPGPGGKPYYPDLRIYYPDGSVYCPEDHAYYWRKPTKKYWWSRRII
jgi:hypothetical protein